MSCCTRARLTSDRIDFGKLRGKILVETLTGAIGRDDESHGEFRHRVAN